MPTFTTPTAIDLAINLQVGVLDVVASDRADTVVTVAPSSADKPVDVRGAGETRVEFDGQRLTVVGPKPRLNWIGPTESVDVTVALPTGSRLTAEVAVGSIHTVGQLGATRIKSSMGQVELDTTADLWLRASHGTASATTVDGTAEITADHGQIKLGTVSGDATLKSSHGSIRIDDCAGDLDAKLSYGDLDISRALASVTAKTAYGSIRLDEVSSGSIHAESGFGQITVGVRQGVAAWLDLSTRNGHVRNQLDGETSPERAEHTVAVTARTRGDITIRRAP